MKRVALVASAALLVLGLTASTASAAWTPFPMTFIRGLPVAAQDPNGSPRGANNWSCRPSAKHPRPVVLLHGLAGSMATNMSGMSPALATAGYCVFAMNYGGPPRLRYLYGFAPMPQAAQEIAAFVDRVLAATRATQVDIVGHSLGGSTPRWYMKFLGGAPKVHTLVGIAPPNHGGSDMDRVNAGGETLPGVNYTVIQTRYDEVVTPYTDAWLTGPRVTNILLQHLCPIDLSDHLNIAFSPLTIALVKNALDPTHPTAVLCRLVIPPLS